MANMNRVDWWMDNMVKESTDARNAFRAGVETVGLAHVGTVVEAIADLLGELDRPEAEQLALTLRNAIYDISETWEQGTKPAPDAERIYPCANCAIMRTKEEGGTVFTLCEACWDKVHGKPASTPPTQTTLEATKEH